MISTIRSTALQRPTSPRHTRGCFRHPLNILLAGCFWLLSVAPTIQAASNLTFKHILPEEVSSLGYINTIAQDRNGFMWFGGANGLGRYDGYELTIYRHQAGEEGGLSHSYINRILPASDGNLWLATRRGINFFDAVTGTFSRYRHPDDNAFGTSANDVRDIVKNDDQFWIASRGGLLRYNLTTDQYEHIPLTASEDDESPSIWTLVFDQNGALWLGTQNHGVFRYHPETGELENFRHDPSDARSITDDDVREVYVDRDNRVWFGTYGGGMASYNRANGDFDRHPNDNHEKSTTVWDIVQDHEGTYWVGDGSAVNRFDPETGNFEGHSYVEGEPDTPGNHVINVIHEDRAGDIWVGYFPAGVDRIDRAASAFNNYAHDPLDDNSITDGGVVSTHEDPQGNIWIGTGYGLNYWDRGSDKFTRIVRQENESNTLSGNTILAIEQQDNILWLGVWSGGLNRLNLDTGEVRHYMPEEGNPKAPPGSEPWGLTTDREGALWMATDAGLARYNRDTDDFTTFQPAPDQLGGDHHLYARVVYEDRRGNLWVGGISGLYLLDRDEGTFTHYHHQEDDPHSLSADFVLSIYEDNKGNLWVGTDGGGLNRFDYASERFAFYTTQDGLPDDSITSIVEDRDGSLWLSTHKGLSRFNIERNIFHNFSTRHGLQGNLYNRNTGLVTEGGEVLFGSSKGFSLFNPADLEPNPYLPPVYITDIQILNQSVEAVAQPDGGSRSVPFADTLTLDPDQSVVTLEYSGLNYQVPEGNQYAYRLLGFEDDWNQVGAKRSATYTNLDPGDYRFQVKASNNDGLWNDQAAELRIRVLPTLWQTWWAYSLYALALLTLIAWLVHTQRQKLAQERKVVKRLQQVDELKDEFLANTSHELRTPLNGIIGLAESLMEGATGELPRATQFNLAMIVSSGRRLASLVDDILDFAKLRNQGITLNRRPIDLHVLAEVVLTLTRPLLGNKNITLVNDIPADLPRVYADEDRLLQILHNLVGNAVKFTPKGTITISAQTVNDEQDIRFSVTDTGIGIAREEFETLFESFRQADGSNDRLYGGTGLGLSITHQLVSLHGGHMDISSEPGQGSMFTVTLSSAASADTRPADPEIAALTRQAAPLSNAFVDSGSQVILPEIQNREHSHILIVDDEPVNRQVLANYLTLGNFRVSECDSGEAALDFVTHHPDVDLVLLDIMMPNLSGYETCRALRERYSTLELPVIFLTAKRQISDLLQAFAAGGNDFLSKPFSKDELLARVNTHLQFLDIHRNLDNKVAERTSELKRINQGLENARTELEEAYQKLEEASLTDPLTGLHNRRYLNQQLPSDISLSIRNYRRWLETMGPEPVESDCLFLLLDIDHFKQVNDTYGHAAGDTVLEALSDVLREVMRDSDYLIRWGGEEFLLVARFANRDDGPMLAERIRAAVENADFTLDPERLLKRTCSIGYAAFPFYSRDPERLSWEQVIDTADRALYAAKGAGRNCWVGLMEGEQLSADHPNPGTSDQLGHQIARGEIITRASCEPTRLRW